jgi:hypothetical protein
LFAYGAKPIYQSKVRIYLLPSSLFSVQLPFFLVNRYWAPIKSLPVKKNCGMNNHGKVKMLYENPFNGLFIPNSFNFP